MVTIVFRDGRHWPSVVCDACKQPIERASNANAVFEVDRVGHSVGGLVYHVHVPCDRVFRAMYPTVGMWQWDKLDRHLSRLGHNLGIDWGKTAERKRILADL